MSTDHESLECTDHESLECTDHESLECTDHESLECTDHDVYYFAYGGNTNPNHMNREYPNAIFVCTGVLKNYQLCFRTHDYIGEISYCDIFSAPDCDVNVYGVVYKMSTDDILRLNHQEKMYKQINVKIEITDHDGLECTTYQMIDQSKDFACPTQRYFSVVSRGYKHYNIPIRQLRNAMFISL